KFRVALVSPELAVGKSFHEHVLKLATFQQNNIGLIIDELYAVEEWGTDDFRPAYGELATLLKRMPTGTPLIMASATLPPLLLTSIVHKLGVGSNHQHVAFSNQKGNVALSVRIMQHAQGTYADLFTLLARYFASPADFPQTLIYVNSRKEAEEIQDFFRRHTMRLNFTIGTSPNPESCTSRSAFGMEAFVWGAPHVRRDAQTSSDVSG
ncbi:hypothetical protein R3P38DRAFT_2524765, partial [Favolaschia claudopus]